MNATMVLNFPDSVVKWYVLTIRMRGDAPLLGEGSRKFWKAVQPGATLWYIPAGFASFCLLWRFSFRGAPRPPPASRMCLVLSFFLVTFFFLPRFMFVLPP